MEQGMIAQGFALALGLAMLVVIVNDAVFYKIPNWLNGLILALYVPAAFLLPADIGMAAAAAGITLAVGMLIFALGLMGGGDVKLIAVLMLWVGWGPQSLQFLVLTAVAGGLLVVIVLLLRALFPPFMLRKNPERMLPRLLAKKEPVPYGLAIAAALLWMLAMHTIPMLGGNVPPSPAADTSI